jgi:hypothetical protein
MGVAKQGEGVHVVAVSRGFELRIATALSDRGVGIIFGVGTLSTHDECVGVGGCLSPSSS